MNNKSNKEPRELKKFDKFEKLDRKVEETIQEVETMGNKQLALKALHTSFAGAAIWAVILNLIIETLGRITTEGIFGGFKFLFDEPVIFCIMH